MNVEYDEQLIQLAVHLYGNGDLLTWPKALALADFTLWELDLL